MECSTTHVFPSRMTMSWNNLPARQQETTPLLRTTRWPGRKPVWVKKVTGSFIKAHWSSEAWGSGCPSQGVSCVDSRRSYPWQPGCSCHCSGTFYLHFEPCSHFDILHAQVTLVAWYQLRQEHIMAMAEMIEDQDVIVRVTLLHIYDPTTLVVSFEWQHCSNLPPVFRRITGHLKLRLLRGVGAWR